MSKSDVLRNRIEEIFSPDNLVDLQESITDDRSYLISQENNIGPAVTVLLRKRIQELDCLNDIGHRIDEKPVMDEFLEWLTNRIPSAMQNPEIAIAAITFDNQVYGNPVALSLSSKIVAGIRIGSDLLGYIHIAYTRDQHFLDEESAFIGAVAGRVSGYLENYLLIKEMERRSFELTILNEMSQSLSNTLSGHQIAKTIFQFSSKLIDFNSFYLAHYNNEAGLLSYSFVYLSGTERKPFSRPLGNGLTEQIIRTGEIFTLQDDVKNQAVRMGFDYTSGENDVLAKSWIGVPIFYENDVLGVMSVQSSNETKFFSTDECNLLMAIARQSAVSIHNSQTELRLEQDDDELLKFKRGIDQSSDAVFITDLEGTITYINPAFEKIYGFTQKEAIGNTPRIIKSGMIPQEQYQYFWQTLLSGEIISGELANKTKDGRIIPIEGANVPILDDDKKIVGFLAIHRDITSRKESEALIAKRSSDLETIAQLSTIISSILEPEKLLKEVVNQVKTRFNLYHSQIYLIGPNQKKLVLAAGAGEIGDQMVAKNWEISIDDEVSIAARSARKRKGITINDITHEKGYLPNPYLPNTKGEMAVPIAIGENILGILDVQSGQIATFSTEDISIISSLASQIAVALQNANQYKETQEALSRTSALLTISQAASSSGDVEDILNQSLKSVLNNSGFKCGLISMINQSTKQLEIAVHRDLPENLLAKLSGEGLIGTLCEFVFLKKTSIYLEDLSKDAPVNVSGLLGMGLQSYYGIPLQSRGEFLGTLCVFGEEPREKEEWVDTLMQAASRQISVSVENILLLRETQSALERADLLYQGGDRVIHAATDQELLDAVVESTSAHNFDRAYLINFDKPWDEMPPDYINIRAFWRQDELDEYELSIDEIGIYKMALVELADISSPTFVIDINTDTRVSENLRDLLANNSGIKSFAVFPLVVGGQFFGAITFQSKSIVFLDDLAVRQINSLVGQAATVLQSLKLRSNLQIQLSEMENLQSMLSREAWTSYISRNKQDHWGYEYNRVEVQPLVKGRSGNGHFKNKKAFDFPLEVRGEIIGGLGIDPEDNSFLTEDEQSFLHAVAEQVSQALERARLIEQTQKSAVELQTVAQVSSRSSTSLEPTELLQSVVDLAKNSFNLYHAHIYLLDDTATKLILSSGAGEIGRKMVEEGWVIFLEEDSIVSRAARSYQGQIVGNVWENPEFLPNPLLPDTKSELAIPMMVGKNLLGVFDVQSTRQNNFTEEDLQTFSTLASQVSVALQNARLYAEQSITVERLRELDHLKTSFLANMSHELRTPLNSILGFTQVILEGIDGPLTDYMVSDLQLIEKNGKHLLNLINEVLDMAKIESGKMSLTIETVDLSELISDILDTTSGQAREKGIYLSLDSEVEESIVIQADQMRLRQIMINLVGNSIKFTETGGVSVKVIKNATDIKILVEDTGIGVPSENLETIFEAFSQVDTSTTRKAGGTGLGLPISRRLVEMHGGKLWAESNGLGDGTTMHLVLPIKAKLSYGE